MTNGVIHKNRRFFVLKKSLLQLIESNMELIKRRVPYVSSSFLFVQRENFSSVRRFSRLTCRKSPEWICILKKNFYFIREVSKNVVLEILWWFYQRFHIDLKKKSHFSSKFFFFQEEKSRGVIAASAGNHALAVCYHGQQLGIPVVVVMPRHAPIMKVNNCRSFGAVVIVRGMDLAEVI